MCILVGRGTRSYICDSRSRNWCKRTRSLGLPLIAVGLLGACFGATPAWFRSALHRAGSSLAAFKFQALLPFAVAFVAEHGTLLLRMAAILQVVPAAVYLSMLRE